MSQPSALRAVTGCARLFVLWLVQMIYVLLQQGTHNRNRSSLANWKPYCALMPERAQTQSRR